MSASDHAEIEALLQAQFAALAWGGGKNADWELFAEGFLPGAPLYPAARPVRASSVELFRARMEALAEDGTLECFSERLINARILVCGNVAVALAGCEMRENEKQTTCDVNAILFVKNDGVWRIAAQAWDGVSCEEAALSNPSEN